MPLSARLAHDPVQLADAASRVQPHVQGQSNWWLAAAGQNARIQAISTTLYVVSWRHRIWHGCRALQTIQEHS